MRRLAFAAVFLFAACDDPAEEGESGTSDASSSTGDELETDADDDSSTGEPESWDGETITVRTIESDGDRSCDNTCGGSACLAASLSGAPRGCENSDTAGRECTCADDAVDAGTEPTHAVSECYLGPNVETSGFSMTRPESWDGRTCEEFCGDNGLGPCAWTHWVMGDDGCFDWGGNGGIRQYGEDMTVRTPFGHDEGGRVRFFCEI